MTPREELERLRKMKRLRELEARLPQEAQETRPDNLPPVPEGGFKVDAAPSFTEKLGNFIAGLPALRGTPIYRIAQGMADPGIAAIQMGAHAIGQGDVVDERIQEVAQKVNEQRGSEGFDPYRLAGNIAITAPMASALTPAATGLGAKTLAGATAGSRFGLLQPLERPSNNFVVDKAKQAAIGAAAGAIAVPIGAGVARMLAPKGNPAAEALTRRGVQPTIGQRLGGAFNAMEEKLQSVPILGDSIAAARGRARAQFNTAAINEALAPIGKSVKGAGFDAVDDAHRIVSQSYDDVLGKLRGVFMDDGVAAELSSLRAGAQNMVPEMASKFEKTLKTLILDRISQAGGLEAKTYKAIDSELGELAKTWSKSALESERELGRAFLELKQILSRAAGRQNPAMQQALDATDAAFARLVRIEAAAKAAKGSGGVFTPGQLMSGVMQADQSARKNAVGRGAALMQDLANQGQQVLGNTVPDSGTTGRALASLLALGSTAALPVPTLATLGGGALLYAPQSQRIAAALLGRRPVMEPFAQALRQYAPVIGSQLAPSVIPRE